jgi:predicted dithiol-disulfide oxidoreductase (DUF899 family)
VTENYANLPRVASRDEWTAARKDLLAREKQLTRQRDALNADRRSGCRWSGSKRNMCSKDLTGKPA